MRRRAVDGRAFGMLKLLNDVNREMPGIEVDFSPPAEQVIPSLNRIIEWRDMRGAVRANNSHEYR